MIKKAGRITVAVLVTGVFISVLTVSLYAFQAYPHTALTDKVDELFAPWDNKHSPGAALGIIKNGRIIYARGYGMANLDYDIPITPQTVFRIGSTSKQFTGMCIAILAEQGKISLDDDIRKYVPELPDFGTPITIRHIVHHTSGLRCYETLQALAGRDGELHESPYYTDEDVIDLLSRQKELNFKTGEQYMYSNTGYFLMGIIVGRASGMKTTEFAKKYIFDPLGMNNTHFHDDTKMIVRNRASGYGPIDRGGYKINMTMLPQIGNGSIFTTIEDFFKWDQNFYNNKLGSGTQNLLDIFLTTGKLNDGSDTGYAFAVEFDNHNGLKTVGHGGSMAGFRSNYVQFPDQRFSVVITANVSLVNPGDLALKVADIYLADLYTETPGQEQRRRRPEREKHEPVALTKRQLQKYAGDYYSDELDAVYRFSIDGESLMLHINRYTSRLTAISPESFIWNRNRLDFSKKGFIMQAGRVQNLRFEKMRQ